MYALVSGSVQADVRFWDLRRSNSVRSIQAHRVAMTALAVHDFAPLIATGSQRQQVCVLSSFMCVNDIQVEEHAHCQTSSDLDSEV